MLLLHDPADIVLHCSKLYYMNGIMRPEIVTNVLFALVIITWFVTRIILYPYHCILSGFESGTLSGYIATVLMGMLYILHCYWFKIMIGVAIRTLKGKKIKDTRSDNDSAESDAEIDPKIS